MPGTAHGARRSDGRRSDCFPSRAEVEATRPAAVSTVGTALPAPLGRPRHLGMAPGIAVAADMRCQGPASPPLFSAGERTVSRDLWDRAHAILQVSPRVRAGQNRAQTPALLKGLIFGVDGQSLSPTHCVKRGRQYRYYVAQRVLKGDAAGDDGIVRRVSAAEIEAAVVDQVRALLRQPEVVVGTWLAARAEAPDLKEGEVRDALARLEPLWGELFPAEQARVVRALVGHLSRSMP